MTAAPRYPSLFQINTRVWLRRLSQEFGKRLTLAEIDDATIDGFAQRGFDWIWLLSVWQTGAAGRAVSRANSEWRAEFNAVLPISAAQVSRSQVTQSARNSGATWRWRSFVHGWRAGPSS
jgi:hypothetical protein